MARFQVPAMAGSLAPAQAVSKTPHQLVICCGRHLCCAGGVDSSRVGTYVSMFRDIGNVPNLLRTVICFGDVVVPDFEQDHIRHFGNLRCKVHLQRHFRSMSQERKNPHPAVRQKRLSLVDAIPSMIRIPWKFMSHLQK